MTFPSLTSFRFTRSLALLVMLGLFAPALAKAANNVPSTANPGRIDQRLSAPDLETVPETNTPPTVTVPESHSEIPAGAEKVHFQLKGVVVDGATVFSETDLKPLYQDLISQNVTLAQMIGVADKITAKYRNAGYILSRAVVPAQSMDSGIIHIRVVEGYINKVTLQGSLKDNHVLEKYSHALEQVRPLTNAALERYLLLANDIPGLSVKGILQRSETPGTADLAMVAVRKIVSADASVDNRGSKYLGPMEISFAPSLNDAFGLGEQLGVAYTTSGNRKLNYYAGNGSIGLDDEGTRLAFVASNTHTRPGFTLKQFDTIGRADLYQLQLSHPFIRTREENLQGVFRTDVHNVENTQLGFITSNDKMRSARVGLDYQVADNWNGVNTVSGLYSEGFNILGATSPGDPNLSRLRGRSDYHKINLDLQRIQSIAPNTDLVLAGSGQLAFDDLLVSEQFGVGGSTYGRGYDDSEIIGDNGIAMKAELQYNYHIGYSYADVLQPYGFFDFGDVSNRNILPAEKKSQSLASTGVGLRLRFTDNLSGQVEIAQPLTRDVGTEQNKDPRYFFGITAHY